MLTLVPQEIEKYAVAHTTRLPEYLEELTRVTNDRTRVPQMLTGPVEGALLQFLVWTTGATRALDVGTFTGFSAQMLAAAMPEDGLVVTCESDPAHAELARRYFDVSPHGHKIDLRLGPALETLKALQGPFDVVFIDADKVEYVDYYERALELLSDRGVIAVDNVLWSGRVLEPEEESDHAIAAFNRYVRGDPRVRHVMLTVRDGVMLVRRA